MGEVIDIFSKVKQPKPKITVRHDANNVVVIDLADIYDLSNGSLKATEYKDVNSLAQAMARIILQLMEEDE